MPEDDSFDVEAAAAAHYDELMGWNLSLEERRDRIRKLSRSAPSQAPTVGVLTDYKKEELEVRLAACRKVRDAAYADFDRIAATLAGPDETLRRVLRAALSEAFLRGESVAAEERLAVLEWHHAL